MGPMKAPAIVMIIAVLSAAAYAQQPTSFNFDRIRYTFYPGEIARSWTEANAFCKSLGKELAIFANRGQIRNVSDYLSPEGGVWTGYKTSGDGKFESVELAEFEWKKEFGTPLLSKAKPKMCGLLSVANYTGIVATDCSTKKAALCSLSNPDAVEAESIRDGKASAEKITKPAGEAKASAKSTKPSPASKETNSTKTVSSPALKAATPKPSTPAPKAGAKPAKASAEKESDEDPKDAKPKAANASAPTSTSKSASKAVEKKPAADAKQKDNEKDGKTKSADKSNDGKSKSSDKSKDGKAKSADKANAKAGAKPKEDVDEEADDEEKTPKPTTRPPTNQTPIQIESEGGRFTFFPNHIMFGGYMEYSRFCEDKGLQPAVFTSRSQLEDIASHVNSVVMVWTGYSTDSQGIMHSVDEAKAPYQPEFECAGAGASQSLMCGALSTAANKVGITLNSCASAHEALCSAKTFAKKTQKK